MEQDLFGSDSASAAAYAGIYQGLADLREEFHRSGRLDDSNAKLDEVARLFASYLAFRTGQINAFPSGSEADLVERLQASFAATARLPQYVGENGESIFGPQPALSVRAGDASLARNLTKVVRDCVEAAIISRAGRVSFDVLNEAFGHFVRDNFRSNIEDAQYMTPPEVVDFMADIAFADSEKEWRNDFPLTVVDPTCGVGSFLAAAYTRSTRSTRISPKRLQVFGQDKVERMVRLAKINLELFQCEQHKVSIGNSLALGSPLDALNGKADLILTNPPFGARFAAGQIVREFGENTPFYSRLGQPQVDSELLFIDRNLTLLKEGGRLLIVVPDGVVSASGAAATLRHQVNTAVTLHAVIELPPVTFAQAGTRTRTAIIYLEKGRPKRRPSVFFASSDNLGFNVSTRKGVQVKVPEGRNDLPAIAAAYHADWRKRKLAAPQVLSEAPSCVACPQEQVGVSWTPNHYSAKRFLATAEIGCNPYVELFQLGDLVEFVAESRRSERVNGGAAFVSVLHILGEGFIDVAAARANAPKTPGTPVQPGEVLFSRINPRIPRVCVCPDFGVKTLCSTEFEVMRAKGQLDGVAIAYLLLTQAVQAQIQSLTSGTSASHNRIKTSQLAQVLIPVPRKGTEMQRALQRLLVQYRGALERLYASSFELASIRQQERSLFRQIP